MHIRDVAIGDTVLAISQQRGLTVHGVVTDVSAHDIAYIGDLDVRPFVLAGNDWEITIEQDWPADELGEAERRAQVYLEEAESNIADKILLAAALDVAFAHLKDRVDRRRQPAGPFWKRRP